MPRGGRSGARGGRKGLQELSWDDSVETIPANTSHKPAPTFPNIDLPLPKPLTSTEKSSVSHYLSNRARVRSSPLFATLDASGFTDDKGKVDKRAGFDPFNDQEKFGVVGITKRRAVPDLSGREYALQYFPRELWPLLDPRRRSALWKGVDGAEPKGKKRKRATADVAGAATEKSAAEKDDEDDDEDEDVIVTGRRRHDEAKTRKKDPTTKNAKQKQGLDAEDDYPDDHGGEEDEEDGEGQRDSEFEESLDEDEENDYNAEQYFDDGGDDDGWGDDDGGGGEDTTYRD